MSLKLSQTLYFFHVLVEVLIIRSDKMVSHMVEESHVHIEKVVDLSHDYMKVILYIDMDTCMLCLARSAW